MAIELGKSAWKAAHDGFYVTRSPAQGVADLRTTEQDRPWVASVGKKPTSALFLNWFFIDRS